jgi:hypothetical protein
MLQYNISMRRLGLFTTILLVLAIIIVALVSFGFFRIYSVGWTPPIPAPNRTESFYYEDRYDCKGYKLHLTPNMIDAASFLCIGYLKVTQEKMEY